MPRRDVPYPGVICSLKERIAEIADALKTKLHSINGVEGDADGDVLLVSDHPAVLITEDQNQHEIKIGLDNSELPAAAVTSVNGETGAVVLDSADIEYQTGHSVYDKLVGLTSNVLNLQNNISAEATARQNGDSALQTNINAVQATIPSEAATAVNNSPTIQQLVYADQNENLKIANVNQYAVGLTGNQRPITGEKQFLSAYKYIKRITTTSSSVAGWRKLWTFSGRCTIKILTMSVTGQQRAVGSTEYMVEFRAAQFDSNQNRQTIIFRSVADDNIVIGETYNPQTDEETFCIYGRVAVSSHEVFMIEESFLESMQFKTNFAESTDTTSYQLSDIGTVVTIGASL